MTGRTDGSPSSGRSATVLDPDRVVVHRVYESTPAPPGFRVLVDRLWPRGVRAAALDLDEWMKDVAPSTGLRRWYGHDVDKFDEFARRYRDELSRTPAADAVARLVAIAEQRPLLLLTATRDVAHSGADVLRCHLLGLPIEAAGRGAT